MQAHGSEIITANTWGRVFWSVFIYREVKRRCGILSSMSCNVHVMSLLFHLVSFQPIYPCH